MMDVLLKRWVSKRYDAMGSQEESESVALNPTKAEGAEQKRSSIRLQQLSKLKIKT